MGRARSSTRNSFASLEYPSAPSEGGGAIESSGNTRDQATHAYWRTCNSLPGLNRTAFPGGMDTSAPVRGLRPMPVFRGFTLNTPKPRNSMRSPCSSAFFMDSKTVSTAISALVFVMPVRLTTSLMISSLIKTASFSGTGANLVPASVNHMLGLNLSSCQARSPRVCDERRVPPRLRPLRHRSDHRHRAGCRRVAPWPHGELIHLGL